LLTGEAARALTGLSAPISIRPEKIRLIGEGETVPAGWQHASGAIRDVVYLGMYKRYLVNVPNGGDLIVMEQNLDAHTLASGTQVTLAWQPEHLRRLA
jgi:ABC-type Fe3+/spermidine/putrescine transport system ATPase subunit